MKKWMNRIGLALMAASAAAMIAADAFADEPSDPFAPTAQKFYLQFTAFSPADIQCDATGPGVRTKLSRNIVGTPLLRITGNVTAARIECHRPDGSRYTTEVHRQVRYSAAGAVRAVVYFDPSRDAMSVQLRRDTDDDDLMVPTILPRAFVRVPQ